MCFNLLGFVIKLLILVADILAAFMETFLKDMSDDSVWLFSSHVGILSVIYPIKCYRGTLEKYIMRIRGSIRLTGHQKREWISLEI